MLLAALATLAGGALQSATGFGFALVAGPALLVAFEPSEAVGTLLVLGVALNALVLVGERRRLEVLGAELAPLLLAALPGLALGALLLEAMAKEALQVVVGAVVILAALAQARVRPAAPARGGGGAAAVGLAAGALTTSTGVNGPPLLLWLLRRGASPAAVRDTLAAGFVVLNLLGAAVLAGTSGRLGADPSELAVLLPCAGGGWMLGRLAFTRLAATGFREAAVGLALAAGVASLVAGLA